MDLLKSVRRAFGGAERGQAAKPIKQVPFPPKVPRDLASLATFHEAIIAARELPDGTPAGESLIAAIHAEIDTRRIAAAMTDGPASPRFSGLRVRKANLPDWWEASGSLILQSPDTKEVEVTLGFLGCPPERAVVVVGAHVSPPSISLLGADPLVVISDHAALLASSMTVADSAMVLIGERTTGTWMSFIDVRNGGAFVVGEDCMIASGISFMTDDTHAIREQGTGRRINLRGGRMMLEDHVWIADHVRMMGDSRIGTHSIVGAASFVKNVSLPPHSISVGRPARPIRHGVTWTRDDEL